MYVDSLACVIVKGDESDQFKINSGVKQGCIMSPRLFKVYMNTVVKEVNIGMGRRWERSEIHGKGGRFEITWTLVCR